MFLTPGAKLAQKVDVNTPLYNAIATTRGEAAAARTVTACRAFQELRAALHEPPTTTATRLAIKRYLAALHYAVHEHGLPSTLPAGLLWVNAFDGNDHCVVRDFAIDHVAALFNLGVCEATLACVAYRTRRTDPDAMKVAARHFQVAAGYFRAAADLPSPGGIRAITCDLYPPALKALEMVMLGNAQQILYEITLEVGNANAILARFAVGARDFYLIAEDSCREPDVVNTCINGYVGRPAGALAAYFDVVAQSAQANACRDSHDMAQQLARLTKAQQSLTVGLNTVSALDTSSLASVTTLRSNLIAALEALRTSISQRKEEAEAENRKVYFVSPATYVHDIVSRQGVKAADVSKVLTEEAVDERLRAFADLPEPISAELSGVASRYSDMVAKAVADEVASINTSAAHLQEIVLQVESSVVSARSSAAAEAARPPSQPASSLEEDQKAVDSIRHAQEGGGLGTLRELQSQVFRLANETKIQVQFIDGLLQTEDAEDRQLRARIHVTRPISVSLAQPYVAKMSSIRANLEQAANADKIVAAQIDQHASAISHLDGVDLVGFVPPSANAPVANNAHDSDRIEALISEMQPQIASGKQQLSEKDNIVQGFEKKKHLENPYTATAGIAEGDAEVDRCTAIIEREYGELKKQAKAACEEMARISQFLSDANVRLKLPAPKEGQNNEAQTRMNEVYKHQAAALKFTELMGHLQQGALFYTREQDVVAVLKGDVEGFVAARRAEAHDISAAQTAPSYAPQGTLYPSGPPQYPPGEPSYPAGGQGHPHDPYSGQMPYQGPPGAWRRQ